MIGNLRCQTVADRQEGRDFLQSVGFDIKQGTYEESLDLLDGHYSKKKKFCINTKIMRYAPNCW